MTDTTNNVQQRRKAIEHLRELIRDINVAMLTTVSEEKLLRSRPMITARHDFDGDLWFFTFRGDPKVDEIASSPQVNVAYADPGERHFVSVSGTAHLVDDRKKIELLWSDEMKRWFPAGVQDPNLALIRVDVDRAEYWDTKVNRLSSMVKSFFTSSPDGDKEHECVEWQAHS